MRCSVCIVVLGVVTAIGPTAGAAPFYSIDHQSPTAGLVSDGDVVTPSGTGQVPPPAVVIPFGAGGLGVKPTAVGFAELDALSFGVDPRLGFGAGISHRWSFSVDEWAVGLPAVPGPSVTTEGASGAQEAAADVYRSVTAPGPVATGPPGVNVGLFDGNGGLTPFPAAGLNLREPNPPAPGAPDTADNVDALDIEGPAEFPVYFSLDADSLNDPLEGTTSTGTAAVNGFSGGDVLVTKTPGGPPVLYALASVLGLQSDPGVVHDDLDALILWENGDGVFQVPTDPYSWLGPQPTDMLLFSIRRESPLTGTLDALGSGLAIEEGDILLPLSWSPTPGIFIAAEKLGLATHRSDATGVIAYGDDLDALDVELLTGPDGIIPEPSTIALALFALAALLLLPWRKRRQKRAWATAATPNRDMRTGYLAPEHPPFPGRHSMKLTGITLFFLLSFASVQTASALLKEFDVADGYQSPFSTRVWTYNSLWSLDGGTIGSNYVAQHGYGSGGALTPPWALVVRNDSAADNYQFSYDFVSADLGGLNPASLGSATLTLEFDVCSTVGQNSQTADNVPMLTMAFGGTQPAPGLTIGFNDSNRLMWSNSSGTLQEFAGYTLNAGGWDRIRLTMDFAADTYDLSVTSMTGSSLNASNTYTPVTTYNVASGVGFTNPLSSLQDLYWETFTDPEDGLGWHKAYFDNFNGSSSSVPVPEPSTFFLATLGLLGLCFYAYRHRPA